MDPDVQDEPESQQSAFCLSTNRKEASRTRHKNNWRDTDSIIETVYSSVKTFEAWTPPLRKTKDYGDKQIKEGIKMKLKNK